MCSIICDSYQFITALYYQLRPHSIHSLLTVPKIISLSLSHSLTHPFLLVFNFFYYLHCPLHCLATLFSNLNFLMVWPAQVSYHYSLRFLLSSMVFESKAFRSSGNVVTSVSPSEVKSFSTYLLKL